MDQMKLPALLLRFHEATVNQARVQPQVSHINVGYGSDMTIEELAQSEAHVVGYEGRVTFDIGKPDGAPRKFMDSGRLNALGLKAHVGLEQGLRDACRDMTTNSHA